MVITIRLTYGTDEKRQTILLHRGLPLSALSNRMLDSIVNRRRGGRRCTKKRTARKEKSVENGTNGTSSHKITEYFPLRRSNRKTEKQLEQEERSAMENAILTGSNEEFLEIFECEEKVVGFVPCGTSKKMNLWLSIKDFIVDRSLFHSWDNTSVMFSDLLVSMICEVIDLRLARIREKEYAEDDSIGSFMYFSNIKISNIALMLQMKRPTKVVELNGSKHLILIAKRNIDIGEELLYDYGDRTPCTVAKNPWLLNS
ncbi:hypothetical protein DINM_001848 [Dirofilaria immitis]|nr:hypothetical protein [Dirofilaria immitis]